MKKYKYPILIIIIAILIVIFAIIYSSRNTQTNPAVSYIDRWSKCPFGTDYEITKDNYIYVNSKVGFSVNIPKGWYVPSTTDTDPHFYKCDSRDGFEIQGAFQMAPDQYYIMSQYNSKDQLHFKIVKTYTSLIPDAIVDQSVMIDPEEGNTWPYWYDIFFNSEKRAFGFASYKLIDQYSFISTFKTLK